MPLAGKAIARSRWPDEERLLFGKVGLRGLDIVWRVYQNLKKRPSVYCFISEETFLGLCKEDASRGNQIYWHEIMCRAHFAAVSSLGRNLAWILGMSSSVAHNQFLPFTASARSLLESSADSWSTIRRVPRTLTGEQQGMIVKALAGHLEVLLINEELENILIHSSHARKLDKTETASMHKEHNAKAPWEYLKELKLSG